jgi:hypothetical protein
MEWAGYLPQAQAPSCVRCARYFHSSWVTSHMLCCHTVEAPVPTLLCAYSFFASEVVGLFYPNKTSQLISSEATFRPTCTLATSHTASIIATAWRKTFPIVTASQCVPDLPNWRYAHITSRFHSYLDAYLTQVAVQPPRPTPVKHGISPFPRC